MAIPDITTTSGFSSLDPAQQRAVITSLELLDREKKLQSNFSDYSFVLFPLGKAYEGFLKKFLYDLGLITEHVYYGKRFRIGRALNPDISQSQRDEWWLYDDVSRFCGEDLARKLWNAWVLGRNHIFHYFPTEQNEFTLQQVESRIVQLLSVFEEATQCYIDKKRA